jgi:hypothetical protein
LALARRRKKTELELRAAQIQANVVCLVAVLSLVWRAMREIRTSVIDSFFFFFFTSIAAD